VPPTCCCSQRLQQQVGGLFPDDHRHGLGVPADDVGHHRGIRDAESLHTANPQLFVDDGCLVRAHAGGADRVVERVGCRFERDGVPLGALKGIRSFWSEEVRPGGRLQRGRLEDVLADSEAGHH
jgi:hypothetical protein